MPLPKPPAKRAALLTPADFDSQAAPKTGKRNQKPRSTAESALGDAVQLLDPAPDTPSAPSPTVKWRLKTWPTL